MKKFKTDTVLGAEYEDTITGIKGKATVVSFYLHACERVTLEFVKDGEIKYEAFDAPRLKKVGDEEPMTSPRTGGPGGKEPKQHTVAPR